MNNDRFARHSFPSAFTLGPSRNFFRDLIIIIICAMLVAQAVFCAPTRTQTIAIHRGWNAIFLQVTPSNTDPAVVFANTPASIVASYFAVQKPVEFVQNPSSIVWNQQGWAVWYGPGRADGFLSSLRAIYGNR